MRPNANASHLKLVNDSPVDIVAMARRSRESAQAFRAVVNRFGAEMPDAMDRFHEAMTAFRTTCAALRNGAEMRAEPTPQQPVALPHAA